MKINMSSSRFFLPVISSALAACLLGAMSQPVVAAGKDPLYNPRAVPHQIDRSAMSVQIQGWTRDLKYPVYPIEVMRGNPPYYATKDTVDKYQTFDLDHLACEIGKAPAEVLKNKKYECTDGVCYSMEGAIIGVDPRKTVKRVHC